MRPLTKIQTDALLSLAGHDVFSAAIPLAAHRALAKRGLVELRERKWSPLVPPSRRRPTHDARITAVGRALAQSIIAARPVEWRLSAYWHCPLCGRLRDARLVPLAGPEREITCQWCDTTYMLADEPAVTPWK